MAMRSLLPVLASLLALEATSTNFLRSGQVTEADARSDLKTELGPTLSPAHGDRLAVLHNALANTFRALPKNQYGNMDHQSVRYAIHRLFTQRFGWFVLGLEPGNKTTTNSLVKEWVPSYLQTLLEQRFGDRGMNLDSLVSFAAALEDLVRRESADRLRTTYTIHNAPQDRPIEKEQDMNDIIQSYYLSFLMSFNLEAKDRRELEVIKADFLRDYPGWTESKAWFEEVLQTDYKVQQGQYTFDSAAEFVSKLGQKYYEFNDKECRSLKNTLRDMEGLKAGRVRLSTFYRKSLYSHWRFTEKEDYLRTLGALDESDASAPQVIAANYIMSRPNCLEVSSIYAICCRNECEELLGHIEKEIGGPSASADLIVKLVQSLPSDTVEVPRQLSSTLLRRLNQVATLNGGKVPLHGRLFAQWMHHAFPRECPYPHEFGTTSPQTPDEWMQGTGQKASTATAQEMQEQIESDVCAINEDGQPSSCTEEQAGGSELPWSENEELPIAAIAAAAGFPGLFEELGTAARASRGNKVSLYIDVIVGLLIALGMALIFLGWYIHSIRQQVLSGDGPEVLLSSEPKKSNVNVKTFVMLWVAAGLFWTLDLLDTALFFIAIFASFVAFVLQRCDGARMLRELGTRSKEPQGLERF